MHPRPVAHGRRSSAVPVLHETMSEPQAIVTNGRNPMSQVDCHLAISVMNLPIAAGVTIIGRGPLRLDLLSGGPETVIGRATEPQRDSTAASADAPVRRALLAPLALPTQEIDAIAASAHVPAGCMKVKQICQCRVEFREMYQRCSSLCWKNLTGWLRLSQSLFRQTC